MRILLFIWLIGLNVLSVAQNDFAITPIDGVNSEHDDIACTLFDGHLVFITTGENDLVNDYRWNLPPAFHLEMATRGDTYAQWNNRVAIFSSDRNDVGPATYDHTDSTLYFSTTDNYDGAKGKNLKIYSRKWDGANWSSPMLLPFCIEDADFTHPHFDVRSRLLVFSSNMPGGIGGMDIWFLYKLDIGWGQPVNPGLMVNSTSNEIFPAVHEMDIVYASNQPGGYGGYDLRKALGDQQWKSSVLLGLPVNSIADDVALLYLNSDKSILSSNREGGKGGDDMYIVERVVPKEELNEYTAVLECYGQRHEGTSVTITNEYGEVVVRQETDSTGHINIAPIRFNRSYRVQLGGVDPSMYTDCVMVIYDDQGNKIRELRFNSNGFADLELLPLSYSALNMLPLEDQSILTINIEGQLFDQQPGDVGSNEPVTILDDNGIPVAIAYTNDIGKFRFTRVEPQSEYTFRLSKETAATHVLITDHGDRITLPVLDAEVNYQRIDPLEAIELVNEYNEKIVVSPKDLFVINRIYYLYNSSWLTAESRRQLDQLAIILERNHNIGVELRSHTDSRGKDEYNLILSERRSKSVVEFFVKKGLDRRRFTPVGFGETMLLNECDDGVECSDPEHAINRRTEIRLSALPEMK